MTTTPEPRVYFCDDDVTYTHDEVASMFKSFLDKYPDRKRTGTYKGINYDIELIHETYEYGCDRDYFAYTIYLTPNLKAFCKTHSREIYMHKTENNYHTDGAFYMDDDDEINIYHKFNGYCDMPYNILSMSIVYSFEDFQTCKTESYVYKEITTWIDIITDVYDKFGQAVQE